MRGIQISSAKPKITSLITVYNSEKYIKNAVRSIQNQNISDIEILIIDDSSKDNSLYILKQLKKEDNRIKIIRNKKNKGILYSKSLGIIKAKGKYIMSLDSDDYFINGELFFKCFKEAIENYIDIIEFSGFASHFTKFNLYGTLPGIPMYFKYKTHNYYVRQPQLSKFIYQKLENNKYKLIDGYLTGKCIKTYILKKTIRIIGEKIYKQRMNFGDDRLINYVLFKIAKTFKFIRIFGYAYNYNNISITHVNNSYNNCHDELINIRNIYKFTKFTNDTELAAFEIFNRYEKIIKPGLNKNNSNYLNCLIKQMLNDKYISIFYKEKLINITNNLMII